MTRSPDKSKMLYVTTRQEWRTWLEKHYKSESRNTTEGPVNWVNKVAAQPAHAADHAIEDFCEAGFAVVAVWFTIRFTAAAAWRLMRHR